MNPWMDILSRVCILILEFIEDENIINLKTGETGYLDSSAIKGVFSNVTKD